MKLEPNDDAVTPGDPSGPAAEGEINTLIPKKKSRKKREASADEELPAPPPPMKTIRLSIELLAEGHTQEWNITEQAQKLGMMPAFPVDDGSAAEEDVKESAPPPPVGGILSQAGEEGLSAEEIARRFEEKYDKPSKPKKKKASRCFASQGVS